MSFMGDIWHLLADTGVFSALLFRTWEGKYGVMYLAPLEPPTHPLVIRPTVGKFQKKVPYVSLSITYTWPTFAPEMDGNPPPSLETTTLQVTCPEKYKSP